MTTLAHWSPVRDAFRFQDEMNALFNLTPRFAADGAAPGSAWLPAIDIYEDADGVRLSAELPGLTVENIDLRVENNTLTLKGERKLERSDNKDNYRRIERSYGTFARSFTLPSSVDTEKVQAEFKNGVLNVFLPRKEETRPKQIKVQVQA